MTLSNIGYHQVRKIMDFKMSMTDQVGRALLLYQILLVRQIYHWHLMIHARRSPKI